MGFQISKFKLKIIIAIVIIIVINLILVNHYSCDGVDNDVQTKEVEQVSEIIPEEPKLISLGVYQFTACCPCSICCGKCDGITASGVRARSGRTIAVDRKIPFGTEMIIDGHTYVAEDRGGGIKGNRIDIYFDTHQEALNFGVQYKEVFVKE